MDDLIVKTITRLITPFIMLYGIYTILNGHLSPGGGFAGGAILSASIILYTLVFGIQNASKLVTPKASSIMESGGILVYLFIGLAGIILGNNFLTNIQAGFFAGTTGSIISAGFIPVLTVAIGVKVASTMISIFHKLIKEE